MVRSYLSPTPVGVGVGTSLIWAVDQTLPFGESLATRDYAIAVAVHGKGYGLETHDGIMCNNIFGS